jgi:hypothetical protein
MSPSQGWTRHRLARYEKHMFESFITAFIIYLVVSDPAGNAPIFLAVTKAQGHARKLRAELEGTAIATAIMLFFSLCGHGASPTSKSPKPPSRLPVASSCA